MNTKQMLKPAAITGVYGLIIYLVCIVLGFLLPDVSDVLPPSVFMFRILSGQYYFMQLLPAVLGSGYLFGFALTFGSESAGERNPFSEKMIRNFRIILIYGVCFAGISFCANEIGCMTFKHSLDSKKLQNRNFYEYLTYTEQHIRDENLPQAEYYFKSALELYPGAPQIAEVYRKLEKLKTSVPAYTAESEDDSELVEYMNQVESQRDSLDYLDAAQLAFEEERYIDAHYFATMAALSASDGDANWSQATQLAAMAWNMLQVPVDTIPEEGMAFYSDKMRGYESFSRNDVIEAYNIYSQLYEEFPDDQEVAWYFQKAKEKLEQLYFYIDETDELRTFESAQGVSFRLKNTDGSFADYYISGITVVEESSRMIQYLRNLSIINYDADGFVMSVLSVPYAKMTAEPVKYGKKVRYEPFLTLVSVDRTDSHNRLNPVFSYNRDNSAIPTHLHLAVSYSDFNLLCKASSGPDALGIFQLYSFSKHADEYGYLGAVYYVAFLHRVLFPLEMLILLVMIGLTGFRYRLLTGHVFKFKWVVLFPLLTIMLYPLMNTVLYFFDVINLVGFGHYGTSFFHIAVIVQLGVLLWTSFLFISASGE